MPYLFVVFLPLFVLTVKARAAEEGIVCVENATIGDLQVTLSAGRTTSAKLVIAYLARIEAYDRNGVRLGAIRELNPDATAAATALDSNKPARRRRKRSGR
jgi:Asp-tRNA(Asn)/Glu-tRNA(Gln) amidotransferase A subunit family amidase